MLRTSPEISFSSSFAAKQESDLVTGRIQAGTWCCLVQVTLVSPFAKHLTDAGRLGSLKI